MLLVGLLPQSLIYDELVSDDGYILEVPKGLLCSSLLPIPLVDLRYFRQVLIVNCQRQITVAFRQLVQSLGNTV